MPIILPKDTGTTPPPPPPTTFTLGTLRDMVRDRIQEQEEDFWSDAELNQLVNEGLIRFSHEERWSWLQSSVGPLNQASGNATLLLQANVPLNRQFNVLVTVSGATQPYSPKRVSPSEGFRLRTKFFAAGYPEWYYLSFIFANGAPHMTLIPTPSAALTVEYMYFREPRQMVSDTDAPDVPDAYVDAVVSWATGMAWLKELNGGGKAQEQFNLYQVILEQARKDELLVADDSPLVVGGESTRSMDDGDPQFPLTY